MPDLLLSNHQRKMAHAMKRPAIYARFSTDKQRESSIVDQVRVCRRRIDAEQWPDPITYSDDGVSGSTPVASRRGAKAMVADAMAGQIDVIVFEGLDRLSRDIGEQDRIVKRLEHRGIRLIGISDGYDSTHKSRKVTRITRGLVNEIYLDDLRDKTRRGLEGQFARGFSAGGLPYGYRSVPVGPADDPTGYRHEIDPDQAKVVRAIFRKYAGGASLREIVYELNRRQVPSPRGSSWGVSGLYGSPSKGTGILNNVIYIGDQIWNRSQWVKDPDTGVRARIERPASEWKTTHREDLRIVSDELWRSVRARMGKPGRQGGGKKAGRRPMTLLGGLLRCGICGGAIVAINSRLYGCAANKDRGPSVCTGVNVRRADLEARLISTLRDDLLSPASIAELQAEVKRLQQENAPPDPAKRIEAIDREIRNLTDAIARMGFNKALQDRLLQAQNERAMLSRPRPQTDRIDGAKVLAEYRRQLADLPGALKMDSGAAREALREVMGEVVLKPEGGEVWAVLDNPAGAEILASGGVSPIRVAGGRFMNWRRRIRVK